MTYPNAFLKKVQNKTQYYLIIDRTTLIEGPLIGKPNDPFNSEETIATQDRQKVDQKVSDFLAWWEIAPPVNPEEEILIEWKFSN
jgi:hypothetical protein